MFAKLFASPQRRLWPVLAIAAVLATAVVLLRSQGRLWICACGQVYVWVSNVWSSDNSQHLFDPYSFSHVLHGIVFFWALIWLAPRLPMLWRLWLGLLVEALWEVFENSEFVIQRYREATASLGYQGDTIVNSMGDILACAVGFWLACRLGWRWSLAFFIITEVVMLLWIRDSLILNIIMLIYPIEAIKIWQIG